MTESIKIADRLETVKRGWMISFGKVILPEPKPADPEKARKAFLNDVVNAKIERAYKVVTLYREGLSVMDIVNMMGVTPSYARRILLDEKGYKLPKKIKMLKKARNA